MKTQFIPTVLKSAVLTAMVLASTNSMANGYDWSTPVSNGFITPYIPTTGGPGIVLPDNGGNAVCGEGFLSTGRINEEHFEYDEETGHVMQFLPGIQVTVEDETFVKWESKKITDDEDVEKEVVVHAVIVKGGNNANAYQYNVKFTSDSGLASPKNNGENTADLSNLTFCYTLEVIPPAPEDECPVPPTPEDGETPVVLQPQWCSPGYWRQAHHLGSWTATDYVPSDLYTAKIGSITRSNPGVRANAPTNPTLLEVLQYPQYYGGGAFNSVGDLLSASHPDVNFEDLRVEDSCPLGRAEAE